MARNLRRSARRSGTLSSTGGGLVLDGVLLVVTSSEAAKETLGWRSPSAVGDMTTSCWLLANATSSPQDNNDAGLLLHFVAVVAEFMVDGILLLRYLLEEVNQDGVCFAFSETWDVEGNKPVRYVGRKCKYAQYCNNVPFSEGTLICNDDGDCMRKLLHLGETQTCWAQPSLQSCK